MTTSLPDVTIARVAALLSRWSSSLGLADRVDQPTSAEREPGAAHQAGEAAEIPESEVTG